MEHNVGRGYSRTLWNRVMLVETLMSRLCVMLWFLIRFRPIHVSPRMYRPMHVSPRVSCNGSYAGFARSTFPPVCHSPRVACNASYTPFARSTYPLVCHAMVLMRVSPDPPFPPCVMQCFLYALRPIHVTPRVSCNRTYAGVARSFPS